MSRLQKKCVLGATTMHALLLLALLVGPAFLTRKEEPLDLVELTFIPSLLTDEKASNPGGASPGGQTQVQPQPQQPVAQPQPTPPPPEPPQKEKVVDPEPPVKEVKQPPKNVEPDEPKFTDRTPDKTQKPKPRQVVVSNKKVKLTDRTSTATAKPNSSNKTDSNTSNNSALASAIRSTRSNLGSGLSSGTDVKMPAGQGGGSGASYANYAQEIQRRYKAAYDRALQAAGDIADGQTQVETSVVILRDGTILNSSIVKPSGNAALDNLTRRVLDSIREVQAFPAGATDSRRTFNIIFDLKPKLNLG
jgi:outer membrane biosynthesis protein TonB